MAEQKKQKPVKKEKQTGKQEENIMIIDATNAILGRLSSFVAKKLLLGETVVIVNCNKAIITGNEKFSLSKFKQRRSRHGSSQKGPIFPTIPERIVKRTIRGMLPHKQGRGIDALKRIKCYNEVPEQYKDMKKISSGKEKSVNFITIKDLVRK